MYILYRLLGCSCRIASLWQGAQPAAQSHLPTALRSSSNAYGWYAQGLGDCCCNWCWDALQHDCKAAAVLQGLGLVDDPYCLTGYLGLRPEAAWINSTPEAEHYGFDCYPGLRSMATPGIGWRCQGRSEASNGRRPAHQDNARPWLVPYLGPPGPRTVSCTASVVVTKPPGVVLRGLLL